MAPRTKDQQKAYNEKRRNENAARKAEADASVKAIKAERKAKDPRLSANGKAGAAVRAATRKAKIDVPVKRTVRGKGGDTSMDPFLHKVKAKPIETKRDAKARAKIEDMSVKPTPHLRELGPGKGVEPLPPVREVLKQKAIAEHKEKFAAKTVVATPEPVQVGDMPQHTMARSYLRSGAPGLGKLRGKTYQATVSFTEGQMRQVVAAANFRQVSLSEMIRSAVVEHLNKGRAGQ